VLTEGAANLIEGACFAAHLAVGKEPQGVAMTFQFEGRSGNYANRRWYADTMRLGSSIRVQRDGEWAVGDAWVSLAIDDHSRAVMGCVVSDAEPDETTVAQLLHHAISNKGVPGWQMHGVPDAIATDNGVCYRSQTVQHALRAMGVIQFIPRLGDPHGKAVVERWFRLIRTDFQWRSHAKPVGSRGDSTPDDAVPTLEDLKAQIERWIIEDYHRRVLPTTGRRPGEHWLETVRLREGQPAELDAMEHRLTQSESSRAVHGTVS
jgi:putative transposase